jgi:hypothetical protein
MSAKLRFRMPEGVDIGARAPRDAHARRRRSIRGDARFKDRRHLFQVVPRRAVSRKCPQIFCQRLLACFANKALLRASAKRSAERYANLQSPDPSSPIPFLSFVSFFVTSSGPIDVPLSDKMFAVKERALAAWPEPSETFSKQVPPGPHAVKIILNGRVLDNGKTLRDVKVATDAVVTCHLMVQTKHPPPSRSMVRAAGKTSEPNPGCGCVVS